MTGEATSMASTNQLSKSSISKSIIHILKDMTSDWDLEFSEDIGPDTYIISNLEFESIDVVQFIVQIEEIFGRKDLPFEKLLMVDGRYRDDMTVEEVVDFLHEHL
jgi:acyl carrier protein